MERKQISHKFSVIPARISEIPGNSRREFWGSAIPGNSRTGIPGGLGQEPRPLGGGSRFHYNSEYMYMQAHVRFMQLIYFAGVLLAVAMVFCLLVIDRLHHKHIVAKWSAVDRIHRQRSCSINTFCIAVFLDASFRFNVDDESV